MLPSHSSHHNHHWSHIPSKRKDYTSLPSSKLGVTMGFATNNEMLEGYEVHQFGAEALRGHCVICHILSPASTNVKA